MKTKLFISSLIAVSVLQVSCNHSPKCGDEDVKKMVIEIDGDKIKNEIYFRLPNINDIIDSISRDQYASLYQRNKEIKYLYDSLNNSMMDFAQEYRSGLENEYTEVQVKGNLQYSATIADIKSKVLIIEGQRDEQYKLLTEGEQDLKDKKISLKDSLLKYYINKFPPHLENIRINNTNDNTKKCTCTADVYSDENSLHSLSYSAQYTEDGKLYITVYKQE